MPSSESMRVSESSIRGSRSSKFSLATPLSAIRSFVRDVNVVTNFAWRKAVLSRRQRALSAGRVKHIKIRGRIELQVFHIENVRNAPNAAQ
jgi:hypothetical protein